MGSVGAGAAAAGGARAVGRSPSARPPSATTEGGGVSTVDLGEFTASAVHALAYHPAGALAVGADAGLFVDGAAQRALARGRVYTAAWSGESVVTSHGDGPVPRNKARLW